MKTKSNANAGGVPARTAVKAGTPGTSFNHNQTMGSGPRIRTALKAGGLRLDNHNETPGGLRVRTAVKAGLKIKRSD